MKYLITIFLAAACLGSAHAWNDALFNQMPADAILVDVDGVLLLKRDVLHEEVLWKKLFGNNREYFLQYGTRPKIIQRFERETLLVRETKRRDIFVSDVAVSGRILEIAHLSGDKQAKYASIYKRKLGEGGTLLENLVQREVYAKTIEREVRKSVPAITDAEMAKAKSERAASNERAKILLAQSWTSASNLWHRISISNDFDKCVAEYEEERNHIQGDPEWGSFTIGFFDDNPRLQKLLRYSSPGQIFPPMEANNGLMIIKVVGIEEDYEVADSKEAKRYQLASLFIAVPYFYPEVSDECLREELHKNRQDQAWSECIESITKAAKVSYPSGREVFDTRTPFGRMLRKSAK